MARFQLSLLFDHLYFEVYLMLHERKNEVFKELFDSCLNLQYGKAKDYATNSDALSNFKSQDAEMLGLTPFQKWGVYFGKQAMSILGAIGKNPEYPSTTSEPIEERIQDAIIYLVLLKCLLEDSKGLDGVSLSKNPISLDIIESSTSEETGRPKADRINIETDDLNKTFKITFQDRKESITMSNIMAYSESNPYSIIEFKPLRIINNRVAEYIIVAQRKWENEEWKSFISQDDLDFTETWFLHHKNLKK